MKVLVLKGFLRMINLVFFKMKKTISKNEYMHC